VRDASFFDHGVEGLGPDSQIFGEVLDIEKLRRHLSRVLCTLSFWILHLNVSPAAFRSAATWGVPKKGTLTEVIGFGE
jgi:hypothetical protein